MPQIWLALKRNPIQIVAAIVVIGMVAQKLIAGEPIEGTDWGIYFLNFAMSFVAREFTVPLREHERTITNLHQDMRTVRHFRDGEQL